MKPTVMEAETFRIREKEGQKASCCDESPAGSLIKRIRGSLAAKIAITLGVIMVLGGGIFWYVSVQNDRRNLLDNTISFVSLFSDVVKKSIRNDMIMLHRENIQKTLESVGASGTITKVQILDAQGVIAYSSDREAVGQRIGHNSDACMGCHGSSPEPSDVQEREKHWTIYADRTEGRLLNFTEPIYNEPDCYTAACHAHSRDQRVLGMINTVFSLAPTDMKIRGQMVDTSWYMLMFLAAGIIIIYAVLWRLVLRPVDMLSCGMETVISGDLSHAVCATSEDEIGRLTYTFNSMTEELNGSRRAMERWNLCLEEEIRKKTDEIMTAQRKIIENEKMAALGRLTADIAHEIRNPLTAVGGYARRLCRSMISEREKDYANIIVSEVHRLEKILRDVLTFSREVKIAFEKVSVNCMVSDSVRSYAALCEEHGIDVRETLSADLPVLIDTAQARYAVNNLITNAVDAMPEGGSLIVTTAMERRYESDFAVVHISDTGSGIPEEKLQVIFEPFYTTKEIGRGTGLGLAISRKVMEEHGGHIKAENRQEGGLTVSLYFPYQSDAELCRTPCWEYMQCGRDSGRDQKCPVFPNFGRVCWVVGGTYCEGRVQGTFAQKCEDCKRCSFYQKVISGEI